jgi:alcohol dehydrogenase
VRAIHYPGFAEPLVLGEILQPEPSTDGVVIQVGAAGLCRSDWHGWQGHDPDITRLPHVAGHEFAGTVTDVGSKVSRWQVGDRVCVPFILGCGVCTWCLAGDSQVCPDQWQPGFHGAGAFADFVAVPRADSNLVAMPPSMDMAEAAILGCRFATAFRAAVDIAAVQAGEQVVVHGCGGLGLALVMIAAAKGARVLAVDVVPGALEIATRVGAANALDISAWRDSSDVAVVDEVIRELTDGGAHVSFDALGNGAVASRSVRTLRPRGRHVQVGLLGASAISSQGTIPMHLVIGRELEVLGSHGMPSEDYPRMLSMIAERALRPAALITHRVTLEEIPARFMAETWEPGITVAEL